MSKRRQGRHHPVARRRPGRASEDGLSWTFTLKKDVTFTDGTPFDAAAVVSRTSSTCRTRRRCRPPGYLALGKVATVEAVDATRCGSTSRAPTAPCWSPCRSRGWRWSRPTAIARSQAVELRVAGRHRPVRRSTKWVKQDHVIARPERRTTPRRRPTPRTTGRRTSTTIVWRFIPDSASRYAALQAGAGRRDRQRPARHARRRGEGLDEIKAIDAPRPGASDRIELNSATGAVRRRARPRGVHPRRRRERRHRVTVLRHGEAVVLAAVECREATPTPTRALFGVDTEAANTLLDEAGWTRSDDATATGRRTAPPDRAVPGQHEPVDPGRAVALRADPGRSAKTLGFDVQISSRSTCRAGTGRSAPNDYELVSAPYTKVGPGRARASSTTRRASPRRRAATSPTTPRWTDPKLDDLLTQAGAGVRRERAGRPLRAGAEDRSSTGYYVLPLYDQQNHYLLRTSVHGRPRAADGVDADVLRRLAGK